MAAYALKMRAAEHRAAVDEWQLREDERSALLDAVDAAFTHYRWSWAQTTVDLLVDAVHEVRARKFGQAHQDRIVKVYEAVRDKRNARKGIGAGPNDKTSFERGQAVYTNATMSIRRSVGANTVDGRGESSVAGYAL